MENAEIVETTSEELTTSGKTLAITIAAAAAVGVGVVLVVNRVMKSKQKKADEEGFCTEDHEDAQN